MRWSCLWRQGLVFYPYTWQSNHMKHIWAPKGSSPPRIGRQEIWVLVLTWSLTRCLHSYWTSSLDPSAKWDGWDWSSQVLSGSCESTTGELEKLIDIAAEPHTGMKRLPSLCHLVVGYLWLLWKPGSSIPRGLGGDSKLLGKLPQAGSYSERSRPWEGTLDLSVAGRKWEDGFGGERENCLTWRAGSSKAEERQLVDSLVPPRVQN